MTESRNEPRLDSMTMLDRIVPTPEVLGTVLLALRARREAHAEFPNAPTAPLWIADIDRAIEWAESLQTVDFKNVAGYQSGWDAAKRDTENAAALAKLSE